MAWSADRSELRLGPPEVFEPTRGERVDAFEVSRDGRWMVAGTRKAYLAFDPEAPGELVRTHSSIQPGHRAYVSPDGRLAASIAGSQSARIQIWNARTGAPVTNLAIPDSRQLAFSPDGRWLACSADGETTLWRTADWSRGHRIAHSPEAPGRARAAFSPDSRIIAVVVSVQATRLVRVETGEELGTLPADRMVNWLTFSPGGDRLAVACEPGYFQLWDLRHLREQLEGMNLDWPAPALPPSPASTKPVRVTVISKASKPSTTEGAASH
jgi:WD40 repeat protein